MTRFDRLYRICERLYTRIEREHEQGRDTRRLEDRWLNLLSALEAEYRR